MASNRLTAAPAASSASTRWMAVSWAWRRAHMARGEGRGQEGPALAGRRVRRPARRPASAQPCAEPAGQLGVRRPGADHLVEVRVRRARSGRSATKPVAQRCTPPVWRTRSRTVHSGHVGTAPSGSGRGGGRRHALALDPQRVDVGGDLHRPLPLGDLEEVDHEDERVVGRDALRARGGVAP